MTLIIIVLFVYAHEFTTTIIEWVILFRHDDKLMTSGLQFAFKSGHSTSMSTLAMKEVVTHYLDRQSNVYSMFIDASQTFDHVRYDRLFQVLYNRDLPPIITRLIIDMYIRILGNRVELCGTLNIVFSLVV